MTYEESVLYYQALEEKKYPPNLQNVYHLLEVLDHPELAFEVIHVTGTNGKGSTSAYIYQILIAAGIPVGNFSSPYIEKRNEMISVNGRNIEDHRWVQYTLKIKKACEQVVKKKLPHPTPFECYTALALLYFKDMKVKIAVVEVGMGGETDATNVFDFPHICVFTSISLDHKQELGETLRLITKNKSGIIKENCNVIVGPNEKEVIDVITNKSREKRSSVFEVIEEHISVTVTEEKQEKVITLSVGEKEWRELPLQMKGKHQLGNLATALCVVEVLNEKHLIGKEAIRAGIRKAYLPCRLEVVHLPFPILFDAAHNEDSIKQMVEYVQLEYKDYKKNIYFGCLADKEVDKMLRQLRQLSSKIHLMPIDNNRSIEDHVLREKASQYFEQVDIISSPLKGLVEQIENQREETIVICTGSFYLTYPLRKAIVELFK